MNIQKIGFNMSFKACKCRGEAQPCKCHLEDNCEDSFTMTDKEVVNAINSNKANVTVYDMYWSDADYDDGLPQC